MTTPFNFNVRLRPDGANPANVAALQSPVQHDAPAAAQHGQPLSGSGNVTVYQTTGPDAHTRPILAAGSGEPALNPRSCVTCRRRKVRCDKQMPCSNCRRARIPCVFPAPGRAPRQPRARDPNAPPRSSNHREAELIKRLRKLEGIVEELSGQIDVDPGGRQPSTTASPGPALASHAADGLYRRTLTVPGGPDAPSSGTPTSRDNESVSDHTCEAAKKRDLHLNFGRLVLDDQSGTSRYVSSGIWSKLNDELDAIREETQRLTDQDDDESDYEGTLSDSPTAGAASLADHHAFVLGYRSADVDLGKCHPLPSHAMFLWSVYQENVEPLIKILHVPTTEVILRGAKRHWENWDKLSPGHEALVFAIYYAAVTSLEPDEVEANLGATKDNLLARYRFGLEQALAKANFLDTSDIAVVQAFTLFLIVIRRHDENRFCWALTGLLIHIVQGLGIHRDGSHFKLSPLETEVRRRLWWAILILDLRSAEELGTDLMISEHSYDTQKPSNINDADLSPESTEPPPPRQGRSDCAIPLVRYEVCALSRRMFAASSATASLCPRADDASIAERERMLIEMDQRIEHMFVQHVFDETDPLYCFAAIITRVITAKMCLVMYQSMMFPGSEHELPDEIRQRIYVAAIEIIECSHKLNTDPRCKRYRWLFKTYTHWHAITYALIETCRRPWTALVERGWEAVNDYDKYPMEFARKADHAAIFPPVRKLFMRARRHRDSEIARLKADQDEARRLDFAERVNLAQAPFGPVPGAEARMEQIREKWRMLIRPDADGPQPLAAHPLALGPALESREAAPQQPQPQPQPQPQQVPRSHGGRESVQMDLSDETMQYMDELLSQPAVNLTELLSVANGDGRSPGASATLAAPAPPGFEDSMVEEQAPGQQPLTLGMLPPKDDHVSPYLWADPFAVVSTKFDDALAEDADMLRDDFDWQDWSQSIRGVEM